MNLGILLRKKMRIKGQKMSEIVDCPFCFYNLENQALILKDSRCCSIILSNPALVEGHCLVIPKRHIERLDELNSNEREDLWLQTELMYIRLLNVYGEGCDIRHNYRPFQTQDDLKVNHLHIHLLPRQLFDELYQGCQRFETDIFRRRSPGELNTTKFKILGEGK